MVALGEHTTGMDWPERHVVMPVRLVPRDVPRNVQLQCGNRGVRLLQVEGSSVSVSLTPNGVLNNFYPPKPPTYFAWRLDLFTWMYDSVSPGRQG